MWNIISPVAPLAPLALVSLMLIFVPEVVAGEEDITLLPLSAVTSPNEPWLTEIGTNVDKRGTLEHDRKIIVWRSR